MLYYKETNGTNKLPDIAEIGQITEELLQAFPGRRYLELDTSDSVKKLLIREPHSTKGMIEITIPKEQVKF